MPIPNTSSVQKSDLHMSTYLYLIDSERNEKLISFKTTCLLFLVGTVYVFFSPISCESPQISLYCTNDQKFDIGYVLLRKQMSLKFQTHYVFIKKRKKINRLNLRWNAIFEIRFIQKSRDFKHILFAENCTQIFKLFKYMLIFILKWLNHFR